MNRHQAKDIFLDTLERPPSERAAFLDAACGDDPHLRTAVMELLAAHGEAEGFLAAPTGLGADVAPLDDPIDVGTTVGAYSLLELLGEGGFGKVYRARQEEPVKRTVAVKVLRPGMDSDQVLPRFLLERQTLAVMDHPGIASIFDAGAVGEHRPYFVMEFVDGPPLTTYCDRRQLGVRERLELFEQVCLAVRHAHQKGVIHRDIKPTNILVTEKDGRPLAKVIDFGIAKSVDSASDDPRLTMEYQLVGTPQYMSPEQAYGANDDLDTRTDIYSLGVVLYELLTGATPLDTDTLRRVGIGGMADLIARTDPDRPSSRVRRMSSSDAERARSIADNRETAIEALRRRLRGDLDAIVMKSIERDRSMRYPTADAFALDIRRHLDHLPVLAADAGLAYTARRFARRHWLPLSAMSAVLVALVVGAVAAFWGLYRAEAALERETSLNAFLRDVLSSARPDRSGDASLLDVMGSAAARIPERFAGNPEQEVKARSLVGEVFLSQSMHKDATAVLAPAVELATAEFGAGDERAVVARYLLLQAVGQGGSIAQIEAVGPSLLADATALWGESDSRTVVVRRILANLPARRGHWTDAVTQSREVVEFARARLGEDHDVTIDANVDLALALKGVGDPESLAAAIDVLLDACARRVQTVGEDAIETLDTQQMLAYLLVTVGRHDEAIALCRRILEASEGHLVDDHRIRGETRLCLAMSLSRRGEPTEAAACAEAAVEGMRARQGDGHPNTMAWMTRALPILLLGGANERGEEYARILREGFLRFAGPDNEYTFEYGVTLSRFLVREDAFDEAESLMESLRSQWDDMESHIAKAALLLAEGELHERRGQLDRARDSLEQAIERFDRVGVSTLLLDEADILRPLLRVHEALDGREDLTDYRERLAEREQVLYGGAAP